MKTTPRRIGEPRGAHPGDVGDPVDQEANSLVLQRFPGLVEVVADQSDVREPWVGQVGGPPGVAAVGRAGTR
jgi:hypothetical protein